MFIEQKLIERCWFLKKLIEHQIVAKEELNDEIFTKVYRNCIPGNQSVRGEGWNLFIHSSSQMFWREGMDFRDMYRSKNPPFTDLQRPPNQI
jgi:hypothetical protein